jgi:hypothetical protein
MDYQDHRETANRFQHHMPGTHAPRHFCPWSSGGAEMQCAALIRCPSDLHQAPLRWCVPDRWCGLGCMPADGAINGRFLCAEFLGG